MSIKEITLWFILLFNRNKTYGNMRQTNYSVWLSGTEDGHLRINYTHPSGCASGPVRKTGWFSYETFVWPGGDILKEEITGRAVDEIDKFCAPVWLNFIMAPWTLGARATSRSGWS